MAKPPSLALLILSACFHLTKEGPDFARYRKTYICKENMVYFQTIIITGIHFLDTDALHFFAVLLRLQLYNFYESICRVHKIPFKCCGVICKNVFHISVGLRQLCYILSEMLSLYWIRYGNEKLWKAFALRLHINSIIKI